MWNPIRNRIRRSYIAGYKKAKEEQSTSRVNRVEIIDEDGRSYTNYDAHNVTLHLQDNGCTLKIFIGGSSDN